MSSQTGNPALIPGITVNIPAERASLPPFPSANGKRGRAPKARNILLANFKTALAAAMVESGERWTTRGWCYALEEAGLGKNDFDVVEDIIVELRKAGIVPLDAVLEDQAREWSGMEILDKADPVDEAGDILSTIQWHVSHYRPISFWETRRAYVVMAVEKRDLVTIFEPVCAKYHVPIANFRGSPDLLSRGKVLREFMRHWEAGRNVVVLYCGDHDPAGLRMSGAEMVSNFAAMDGTVLAGERLYFDHGSFTVDRFGLNADFIEAYDIQWTENLQTGQKDKKKIRDLADPAHDDHGKAYVQDYIREFGARKVEANVLVKRKDAGQRLCRKAIERYIQPADVKAYAAALGDVRKLLDTEVRKQLEDFEMEELEAHS